MTVAELIEKLRSLPPTLRVVTLGYEGGYQDVEMIARLQLAIGPPEERGVYGEHSRPSDPESLGLPVEEAVLIGDPADDRRGE